MPARPPRAIQFLRQPQAALHQLRHRIDHLARRLGSRRDVHDRPGTDAGLIRRFPQRHVFRTAVAIDLHFIQVEILGAGELDPHVTARRVAGGDLQRFLVGESAEQRAVVRVEQLPVLAILGEQDLQARGALRHAIVPVVDHHAIQRQALAQVDLPPGLLLLLRVKAEMAIHHAVATARLRPTRSSPPEHAPVWRAASARPPAAANRLRAEPV